MTDIDIIIISLLIFVFLDITLTFYQFFICKKIKQNLFYEVNPIIRFIIGKSPTPQKYLISCSYTIGITYIICLIYYCLYDSYFLYFIGIITGIFVMVNMYHIQNLRFVKKKLKNDRE